MNILFLTVIKINHVSERGVYTDLLRKFRDEGHAVYIACPNERRYNQDTFLTVQDNIHLLKIKTLNIQKTNFIEKGLATILLEQQYLNAIKRHCGNIKFDLILYATPPITLTKVIKYFKIKNKAKSYLLLKDIFPQNAVDLNILKKSSPIYQFFRRKEKKLYAVSDYIGCMSDANVDYVKKHNININHIGVNPNSINPDNKILSAEEKKTIKLKYHIPEHAKVLVYGGNLGKPQGIDFFIDVLAANVNRNDLFFIIAGSGTEYSKLHKWISTNQPANVLLFPNLPHDDYHQLVCCSDAGLIFLDKRFTIPNFPSKILSYMECRLPIIAATDKNTDVGKVIEGNKFGFWCESGDLRAYNEILNVFIANSDLYSEYGDNGFNFLITNYHVNNSYQLTMDHLSNV